MGLAGRKAKQRIGADPRNLTWADDASKFGQTYLQKLGWDPSKGLGVSGEGMTSHIKVRQKLNLLGIGSNASREDADPMVAWKQNREYEELLKRLNEEQEDKDEKDEEIKEDTESGEVKEKKKRKKRDGDAQDDANADDEKTREKKKHKKDKKKKRKGGSPNEKAEDEDDKQEASLREPESTSEPSSTSVPAPAPIIQAPTPRPMAHRARFLRSKQLASRSSTAVAEILGISSPNSTPGPSSSLGGTPFPPNSTTPSLNPTPSFTPTAAPEVGQDKDQEIRTASTSVHDYFKEKLAARALARSGTSNAITPSSPSSFNSTPGPSSTPTGSASSSTRQSSSTDAANRGSQSKNQNETEDNNEAPRAGLGSRANYNISSFTKEDGDAPRAGLALGAKSKPGLGFGGLMGGFVSASHMENGEIGRGSAASPDPDGDRGELDGPQDEEGEVKTKRKKEKKEKKKRKGDKREEDAIQEEADVEVRNEERKSKSKPTKSVPSKAAPATDDVHDESAKKRREREEKKEKKEKKKKRKEKEEKRESDAC
ncbi:hypothetical protein A7U60_g7728 [Sanghuangporus baumii]|uniref:PinX1-related protein 1 n=1 Tax=Sanghuangporus baumii TaxID=108892 RepID=A0A9Q5HSB4_SANBA|nr:hypothetical protein A7U60_g7728 [Sanghuangporus baumii]